MMEVTSSTSNAINKLFEIGLLHKSITNAVRNMRLNSSLGLVGKVTLESINYISTCVLYSRTN